MFWPFLSQGGAGIKKGSSHEPDQSSESFQMSQGSLKIALKELIFRVPISSAAVERSLVNSLDFYRGPRTDL